ncbi:DUF4130 domain-containing protein, partial [Pandoraea sputorum]|uniref:DUF4130 domain-containing protein n=1 Tax=Pandoraea sputorum TaxID=93222 RepID=UPI00355822C2
GSELQRRLKQVSREAHHLHAFLRFVAVPSGTSWPDDNVPDYIAWHEPAHDILASASTHFIGRMGRHRWLIATPKGAVFYDASRLIHHRQCPD